MPRLKTACLVLMGGLFGIVLMTPDVAVPVPRCIGNGTTLVCKHFYNHSLMQERLNNASEFLIHLELFNCTLNDKDELKNDTLSHLPYLQTVNMSTCGLRTVAACAFCNHSNISGIDVTRNELHQGSFRNILFGLHKSNVSSLEYLLLGEQNFADNLDEMWKIERDTIKAFNGIEIEFLDLMNVKMNEYETALFQDVIHLRNIKCLIIAYNDWDQATTDSNEFTYNFWQFSSLVYLDYRYQEDAVIPGQISETVMQHRATAWQGCKDAIRESIQDTSCRQIMAKYTSNFQYPPGDRYPIQAPISLPRMLKKLLVSQNNNIKLIGTDILIETIRESCVTHLDLSGYKTMTYELFAEMNGFENLETLDLANVVEVGFSHKTTNKMPKLEHIDLSSNYLKYEAKRTPTLRNNHKLKHIDLSKAGFTEADAEDPRSLLRAPSVESIDLSANNIGLIPMKLIRNLTKLKHIDLSSNPLKFDIPRMTSLGTVMKSRNLTITISNIQFSCLCNKLDRAFVEWFHEHSKFITNADNIKCKFFEKGNLNDSDGNIMNVNLADFRNSCMPGPPPWLSYFLAICLPLFASMVMAISAKVWLNRWRIYAWYLNKKKQKYLLHGQQSHVMLIYGEHDARLVVSIREALASRDLPIFDISCGAIKNQKVAFSEKNTNSDELGGGRAEELANAVKRAKIIVVFVSRQGSKEDWFRFTCQMALVRVTTKPEVKLFVLRSPDESIRASCGWNVIRRMIRLRPRCLMEADRKPTQKRIVARALRDLNQSHVTLEDIEESEIEDTTLEREMRPGSGLSKMENQTDKKLDEESCDKRDCDLDDVSVFSVLPHGQLQTTSYSSSKTGNSIRFPNIDPGLFLTAESCNSTVV